MRVKFADPDFMNGFVPKSLPAKVEGVVELDECSIVEKFTSPVPSRQPLPEIFKFLVPFPRVLLTVKTPSVTVTSPPRPLKLDLRVRVLGPDFVKVPVARSLLNSLGLVEL
jgi:hypothetical protein